MHAQAVGNRQTLARGIVFLFLASTITAGITIAPGSAEPDTFTVCESGCDSTTIQTAIDLATSKDTVLVGPGTYEEKLRIDSSKTGLRLLAQEPGTVTVDASQAEVTALSIRAPGALVRGITLEWDDASDSNIHGVWISADDVRLEDNTIRLTGSTNGQFTGVHIQRASGILVTGNTIESDLVDLEEQKTHTANGVYVQGGTPAVGEAKNIEFSDNTFTGWATHAMFLNQTEATRIDRNTFLLNNEGVLLCNTKDTRITHNTFRSHFTAVHLCDTVNDPVLHKNGLASTNEVGLRLDDRIESALVDARLNDWGVHDVGLLDSRIEDEGNDNEILQVPFLDAIGAAEPPLVRIHNRPDEPFFTVQDALAAAQPGDTVLVPASGNPLAPLVREGSFTISTSDVTLCSSIGGSPLCAKALEPGHWQLSRSEWVQAPTHGHGSAMRLDDPQESGTWGSTSFFPPDGFRVQDLEALSLDVFITKENPQTGMTCGAGAPRIGLAIDTSGDGARDGTITIIHTTLNSGCTPQEWIYADFFKAESRWRLGDLGGPNGVSQAQAFSWIDDNLGAHDVLAINAIMDNGATAVVDNQRINDWILGEPQDIGCYWAQENGCRWNEARARTLLDGQGAPRTLTVDAPGVTVHGFTIRNTVEETPVLGVDLAGDGAVLRDSDIQGNFSPSGHDGRPTVNQIGVEVGTGAKDVVVQDNRIRDWHNIGIFLSHSSGSGSQILRNEIEGNRWHGILAEGPTTEKGAHSATITGNTIRGHGHSALRIGTQDPGVLLVRENLLDATNLNGVTIQQRVEDATIDVRLNNWSVYDVDTLATRVDDESGTNRVLQIPFIDATGEPEPPLVQRVRPDTTGPPGPDDRFLSFQEAIDHPDSVPGTRIQALPARTAYPGPVDLHRPGITLCGTLDGTDCDADPTGVILSGDGLGEAALTVHDATNITIQRLTLAGGSPVVAAESAAGLLLQENVILSEADPLGSSHGVRIADSPGARVEANQITGNLYPGSLAVAFKSSDDAQVMGNRIDHAATGIHVLHGNRTRIEDNRILATPGDTTAGETLGIHLDSGSDHRSTKNTVYGAGTGLLTRGSTQTASESDRFISTVTAVRLQTGSAGQGLQQPHGFHLTNASLAASGTALHLGSGTNGLEVDARCDDWGVYSATAIETNRITDEGSGNQVTFTPYVAPAPDSPLSAPGCLSPPMAAFTYEPESPDAGHPVRFQDTSSEGSRPLVEQHWDFGDGTTTTDTFPFQDSSHTYASGGIYLATLTVTDTDDNTATSVLPIPVGNPPPRIVAPFEEKVRAGDELVVPVSVVDLDGNASTLTASDLPDGAQLLQNETEPDEWQIVWTPGPQDVGVHVIELTAADLSGANTTHLLTLIVRDAVVLDPSLSMSRQGVKPGPALPGQPLTFQARLVNQENVPVELELEATTVAGWATSIHGDDALVLEPGEMRTVKFDVAVGDGSAASSFVDLIARPPGESEGGKRVSWKIRLPVETDLVMGQPVAGDNITGTVNVRFLDGSPAASRPVRIEHTYENDPMGLFTSHLRGETDADGDYAFTFPSSQRGAHLPGDHRLIVDVYSPRKTTLEHEYRIAPGL